MQYIYKTWEISGFASQPDQHSTCSDNDEAELSLFFYSYDDAGEVIISATALRVK